MRTVPIVPILAFALSGCIFGSDANRDAFTTVWSARDGARRITDTVLVKENETLVIEAGVDVLFDADVPIFIEGVLEARGTATDSVRFLRGTANEWAGIRVEGGDTSTFAYARISGARAHNSTPCPPSNVHCTPDAKRQDYNGGALRIFGEGTRVVMSHSVLRDNVSFSESGESGGGAIYLYDFAGLALSDCAIIGNTSVKGGGVNVELWCSANFDRCVFDGNSTLPGSGGALFIGSSSTVAMTDCVFNGNHAMSGGGTIHTTAGAVVTLTACDIEDNSSEAWGGTVSLNSVRFAVTKCVVRNNRGGITVFGSKGTLSDCVIEGNTMTGGLDILMSDKEPTGAAGKERADLVIANCTILGNEATPRGPDDDFGGVRVEGVPNCEYMRIVNCIVRGNARRNLLLTGVQDVALVSYSNVGGGCVGTGNIDVDPLFVDSANDDYNLRAGSPCIDAGDPATKDPNGSRADIGARLGT